ncbi:hypothetical protein M422DRAFT_270478 [Sphaerobolus stellatus SS14]|uniref:Uncharacterized protein n=1 Tax=Sphaerobolus stellatus (strain SS14) TaxID=990650 RepID=A0A0C9USB1_SPHS4|nr:hypothetical protein M422DRAFT_270478 [Sphaerobolus stellatus SS14]
MTSMASKPYLIGKSRLSSYASSSTSEILVLRTRLRTRFPLVFFLHIYAHTGHHNPKFSLSISPVRHCATELSSNTTLHYAPFDATFTILVAAQKDKARKELYRPLQR